MLATPASRTTLPAAPSRVHEDDVLSFRDSRFSAHTTVTPGYSDTNVPGHWRLVPGAQTVHLSVGATSGFNGSARIWRRRDGVQIRLLWAVCGSQQIDLLAKSYAISQAQASAAWHDQSMLGANVDLVQSAPGGRVWRFWLQGNLDLALETTCGHRQRSTAWLNPVGNARLEEVFTRAFAVSGPIIATAPAGGGRMRGSPR